MQNSIFNLTPDILCVYTNKKKETLIMVDKLYKKNHTFKKLKWQKENLQFKNIYVPF